MKFSPDEKFVYVVTQHRMEKRDAKTGDLISFFKGYITSEVKSASISEDCTKAIVGMTSSDSVAVWDIAKEELQWIKQFKLVALSGNYYSALSPDGKHAYLSTWGKRDSQNIILYNVDEERIEKIFDHWGGISGLCTSPDGKYLATMASITIPQQQQETRCTLLDAATMKPIKVLSNLTAHDEMKFSRDSKKLAFSGQDNFVYDIEKDTIMKFGEVRGPRGYCFTSDNKYFILSEWYLDYVIQIWSMIDGRKKKEYKLEFPGLCSDISKDNQSLVFGIGSNIFMFNPNLDAISVQENQPGPRPYKFIASKGNIEISANKLSPIKAISIIDISGKVAMTRSFNGFQDKFSFDLSSLSPGAYFCRISCGEKTYTEQFVVTR